MFKRSTGKCSGLLAELCVCVCVGVGGGLVQLIAITIVEYVSLAYTTSAGPEMLLPVWYDGEI